MPRRRAATSCSATPWSAASPRATTGSVRCSPRCSINEGRCIMNWTLEVVVVPVSDVDRAKDFYAQQLGFNVDHDTKISSENRVVQLTPPGSGCSIVVGQGVVSDIHKARAQLVERGVEVSEVQVLGENPIPGGDPLDNVGFVFFSDPDGNGWAVQQISARG